ncbi:MAG: transglutaminase domain-containing protein [Myxococcales bacterium]|nr:transglutaminase domain-containing protein [Myxococcales bacterium]
MSVPRAYALTFVVIAGCAATQRSADTHATQGRPEQRPERSALVAASAVELQGTIGVVSLSEVAIEIVSPAPTSLSNARFEIVRTDGTSSPIEPVRDGEDQTAPSAQHRATSFVVDYDQEPLRSRCESPANQRTVEALSRRTEQWITRKNMAVGFVTASVVFERREGDCTEHAVLAAAFLRCNGIPARLASGYAIVREGNVVAAVGHMWTEQYDRGWRVVDAALPSRAADAVRLRFATIEREGPDINDDRRLDELLNVTRIRIRARP